MKKIIPLLILFLFLSGCERNNENLDSFLTAKIAGFDLNCSTCILEFPDDSLEVSEEIGLSRDNCYQSVNLDRGDYQTGQKLKVKIRKAETGELSGCLALYPSNNYQDIFVTDVENYDNLKINGTVYLSYNDCLNNPEDQWYICFKSVLNDSRCAKEVICFWEGNASVRFKYEKYNSKPVIFDLNTHLGFTHDTIIDNYKFTLLDLSPYPSIKHRTKPEDYKVKILIQKE